MEWSFWRKIMLPLWAAVVCGWFVPLLALHSISLFSELI